jgi:hypothetical protein
VALAELLTDAEVDSIIADMREGLALLTGGRLGPFASIDTRTSAVGAAVSVSELAGTIVVSRQVGLTQATKFWGYARWSTTSDGAVTRGFITLDRDFEQGATFVDVRPSLRMHELGHTLGCQHVDKSLQVSVMNNDAQTRPNTFDLQAVKIAMQRPLGNRAPDIDPAGTAATTLSRSSRAHTWHGAH